jgi:DNA-binding transcriptional MerR regulator
MNETSRLITISELSTRYDVTHRALRFYEVCGLLSPLRKGRQRLYSDDDGQKLSAILSAKPHGLRSGTDQAALVRDPSGWTIAISQSVAATQIELLKVRLGETQAAIDSLKFLVKQSRGTTAKRGHAQSSCRRRSASTAARRPTLDSRPGRPAGD